ncbi:MAG: PHP domain-containing protein [Methanomicrobiales archaeon]|nr:PHP domain-containing protein [Methanomicrobiales archaeon]
MTSPNDSPLLVSEPDPDDRILIDLHVHSSYSADSAIPISSLIRCWKRYRILSMVCDHDAFEGSLALIRAFRDIDAEVPEIPAMEVTSASGEIIGLFLNEEIPPRLPAEETVDRIRDQGALVLVPHPFCIYRSRVLRQPLLDTLSGRIDAIEGYNGRNTRDEDNLAAVAYARERGFPITAGSDAHTPLELARTWMALEPFETPKEFLASLGSARIHYQRTHPGIHVVTKVVKRVKGIGKW